MKLLEYRNINLKLTLENICPYIEAFWVKKVIIANYSKIWLTIIVSDNTKDLVLTDNIPFNTSDYTDVSIVLKQILESKLYNFDIIEKITFKYYMEKPIITTKNFKIIDWLFVSWMLILTLLLILNLKDALQINVIPEYIRLEDLNLYNNDFKLEEKYPNNKSLNPFIEMLRYNSSYSYFPSYFSQHRLITCYNDFNMLEYILYQQYHILAVHSTLMDDYVNEVRNLVTQYHDLNNRIILSYADAISFKKLK